MNKDNRLINEAHQKVELSRVMTNLLHLVVQDYWEGTQFYLENIYDESPDMITGVANTVRRMEKGEHFTEEQADKVIRIIDDIKRTT